MEAKMNMILTSVEVHDPAALRTPVSQSFPLGPTITSEGTNFSVFSANATAMEIVLFDHADAPRPTRVIALDPLLHRTSHYWHIFVPEVKSGQLYGYRADGPYDPPAGHRFDRHKVLLDPYGTDVCVGRNYDRAAASRPGANPAAPTQRVLPHHSPS